jgi:hypothetical protein
MAAIGVRSGIMKSQQFIPKTLEGDVAPLQRIDIHSKLSTDIILKSSPQFTPTFIVVSNNKEVGRIEGYPGEDFFWGTYR